MSIATSYLDLNLQILKQPTQKFDGLELRVFSVSGVEDISEKMIVGKGALAWNADSLRQLKNCVEKAKEEKTLPKSISVCFDNGSELKVLFVHPNIKVFDLHVALRKNFSAPLKQFIDKKISLDISTLAARLQKEVVSAFATLIHIFRWEPQKFGKKSAKSKAQQELQLDIRSSLKQKELEARFDRAKSLGQGMNLVRTLSEMPPNILNPKKYVEILKERARDKKYSLKFHNRAQLLKMGAGAIGAVIQGSPDDSGGIAHLTWKGKSKGKGLKKIIFVGKGLCFDTGGHNLKTGNYMNGMHRDMTGSAVALALFESMIEMNAPFEVHAMLGLAENHISSLAYKPNDVVIALDGTSIEVVDTDAEGRMVLADTLAYARKEKPDLVLDFATLTGSATRAIGTRRCAIFSNDKKLMDLALKSGDASGERVWGFPIGEDYREALKSEVADIIQCLNTPNPDHISAATFLSHFVGDEVPWIHMDLAADTNKGGLGLVASDNTAFGVRWGVELVESYFGTSTLD